MGITVSASRKFRESGNLGDVSVNSNQSGLSKKHLFSFLDSLAECKSTRAGRTKPLGKRVTENCWCPKSHSPEKRG